MKKLTQGLLVFAVVGSLGSCQKKQVVAVPPEASVAKPALIAPAAPAPPPVIPALTADQRAEKLGFAKHLPPDTESFIGYYQGSKTTARLKSSKFWGLVQVELNGEDAPAPEPDPAADAAFGPAALFGTEFSIAFGKPASGELGNFLTLNNRNNYFQTRYLVKAFAESVKSANSDAFLKAYADSFSQEVMSGLLSDPKSGMDLVEKLQMPPLYLAFKVKPEDREAAAGQLSGSIGMANMLGEMVEPVTADSAGSTLTGVKILGEKISATLADDREDMDAALTPATADRLLAALAKKDIVLLSGNVGDYVVLFIGPSVTSFQLSPDSASSLCAGAPLSFADAYATKELAAVIYTQKAAADRVIAGVGGISTFTDGLRDGIDSTEGLGDTRDLDATLRLLAEREEAMKKFGANEATGTVAYYEDGLKIESVGGYHSGATDYQASNSLAHLRDAPGTALFANFTGDPVFQKASGDYIQALFETISALGQLFADSPLALPDLAKAREMTQLFNTQFRADLLALWGTFSTEFRDGLTTESAWVVDLAGTAPKVPGASEALLAEAKVPRISLISPVRDRQKLANSWTKMNATAGGTLAKIGKLMGREIPMQEPLSSEKNGSITWFFALPFTTNDFLPSVTLNDRWFIASTSKNQASDLIARADAGGTTDTGFYLAVNFKELGTYVQASTKLAEVHAAELTGAPFPEDMLKGLQKVSVMFEDLDRLTLHSRRVGGEIHTSIHFKTR